MRLPHAPCPSPQILPSQSPLGTGPGRVTYLWVPSRWRKGPALPILIPPPPLWALHLFKTPPGGQSHPRESLRVRTLGERIPWVVAIKLCLTWSLVLKDNSQWHSDNFFDTYSTSKLCVFVKDAWRWNPVLWGSLNQSFWRDPMGKHNGQELRFLDGIPPINTRFVSMVTAL